MLFQGIYMPGSADAGREQTWGVAAGPAVMPGKGTKPVPTGTVRPPVSGWGGSTKPGRKCV